MQTVLIVILVLVLSLFALSSTSQSYASAKQAQAVIEANRTAQIASVGNLVMVIVIALIVIAVLATIVLLTLIFLRNKNHPKHRWNSNSTDDFEFLPMHQARAMLPTLLTIVMYQLMQEQQQHHQETDQFLLMNETASDMSMFSDNSWDM